MMPEIKMIIAMMEVTMVVAAVAVMMGEVKIR